MAVIENMYHKANACVINNGSHSELFDCNIGVRQGCPLSPLLFSLFINDVLSVVESEVTGVPMVNTKINGFLFTNDMVLCADNEVKVQASLDALSEYCKSNGLKVNITKSKVMPINGNLDCLFLMNNIPLEVVDKYKYLGFYIHKSGKMSAAIDCNALSGIPDFTAYLPSLNSLV